MEPGIYNELSNVSNCTQLNQNTEFWKLTHHFNNFLLKVILCLMSWVALHGMSHSFIELDKAVVLVIRLVSFL